MNIEIFGNQSAAKEVLALLDQWDKSLNGKDLEAITQDYLENAKIFDVVSHVEDLEAYRKLWRECFMYLGDNIQMHRRKLTLYASEEVAFLSCFSKVVGDAQTCAQDVPWCRTTFGLYKKRGQWKVVHEHISMPFDCNTQQALYILGDP